ncbi:hypothetical protein [Helicobacter pylori]|uniref:hypothetical protein n=1 Tax=Helicobacter pylori TaxID=210 RepID=UPI000EABC836|nr:hypothetical protein [Helicobacter pylori]KAA6501866.1 hypothetical protein EPC73_01595 [Helicobacter pylori]KAA6503385.1 hypothetical protein EPC78_07465 [Helicobacter pylori]KAA6517633.1 hypothetical protein EPC75_04855 [Helicobacter pylori]RKV56949.1 hypothetical protein DD775_00555 [Helicobacter pylori]
MAFYDFLVSKPLFNQYGHSAKMKSQSLQAIELTNNRHKQIFEKSKMSSLFLKIRDIRLAVLMGR